MAVWTSQGTGNWEDTTTWKDGDLNNGIPDFDAGDSVVFAGGHVITAQSNTEISVESITGTGELILRSQTSLQVDGNVTGVKITVNGASIFSPWTSNFTVQGSTTRTYTRVGRNVVSVFPVGTIFLAAGFTNAGNNGFRVVSETPTYANGDTTIKVAPTTTTLVTEAAGTATINLVTPVAIGIGGTVNNTAGIAIEVTALGAALFNHPSGSTLATTSIDYAIKNYGMISSITGNSTATGGGGTALKNLGTIIDITGNQSTTTGYAIYNSGVITTITGNQTVTTGVALDNDGVITAITGNQSATTGFALNNAGVITALIGNQLGSGVGGTAIKNYGTISSWRGSSYDGVNGLNTPNPAGTITNRWTDVPVTPGVDSGAEWTSGNVDPTEAKVLLNTAYSIHGVAKTGSAAAGGGGGMPVIG